MTDEDTSVWESAGFFRILLFNFGSQILKQLVMAKAKRTDPGKHKSVSKTAKVTISKNIKPKTKIRYLPELCEELEKASAGLFNISESDSPYEFFTLHQRDQRGDGDKLTSMEFLNVIGLSQELIDEFKIPVDQLIEERPLDNFFPTIDDIAGYHGTDIKDRKVIAESKRYRKLEALLKKQLDDVKVFRVGKVEIRCYTGGFAKHGNIAGLVTTAIET